MVIRDAGDRLLATYDEGVRLLVALGLLKGVALILVLTGLGLYARVVGNTGGRVLGVALLGIGFALTASIVRSFAKPS